MITTTLSFAMHILMSSKRVLQPVKQILEYVLPVPLKNMANLIQHRVNFNGKHLKKGDPLPPYNGKLRVYNMRFCPFAQRTILALLAKNVDFEVVNVNLQEKPEWLTQKSAFGKVPSIEIKEDVCIYESLITVDYLDDVYPQRPLLSKDPVTRAYDKIIAQCSGTLHSIFFKSVKDPDAITDDNILSYKKTLHFLQDQLKERNGTFFGGKEPGYADYMIWPWFERLLVCQKKENKLKADNTEFQILNDYISNMLKDAAVHQYLVPEEIYLEIFKSYNLGEVPNFDLLKE